MHKFRLIQVFRGMAALLVLLFHITLNLRTGLSNCKFLFGFFTFGGAGVDFFFVLSGFIIFYSSDKLLRQGKQVLYLKNRLTRIYPVYIIIASCLLFLQIFLPEFFRVHFNFTWRNISATLLLLPGHTMVNGVSWSLSFELYFYLFFLLVFSVPLRVFSYGLVALYTLVIIFAGLLGFNKSSFFLSPLIIDFFIGLIIIPVSRLVFITNKGLIFQIIGVTTFFIFGALYFKEVVQIDSEFKRVAFYGIPSFLIVLGAYLYEIKKEINPPKSLLRLGDMSYSLYLIHLPLVVVATKAIRRINITDEFIVNILFVLFAILIILIVYIFHLVVEKPIMNAFKSHNKAIDSVSDNNPSL